MTREEAATVLSDALARFVVEEATIGNICDLCGTDVQLLRQYATACRVLGHAKAEEWLTWVANNCWWPPKKDNLK